MNDYQVALRDDRSAPTGLATVAVSFKRAAMSQLHPKMLGAVLLPPSFRLYREMRVEWAGAQAVVRFRK